MRLEREIGWGEMKLKYAPNVLKLNTILDYATAVTALLGMPVSEESSGNSSGVCICWAGEGTKLAFFSVLTIVQERKPRPVRPQPADFLPLWSAPTPCCCYCLTTSW